VFLTPRVDAVIQGLIAWWLTAAVIGAAVRAMVREDTPWAVSLMALILLVGVPIWLAIIIGRGRYHQLMGRYPLGRCQKCGYDLTGNVSGRCPECGLANPCKNEQA
jgi:hypothetical protein